MACLKQVQIQHSPSARGWGGVGGGDRMMRGGGCRNKEWEVGGGCRASQSLLLHFYQAADTQAADTQAEWQRRG